MASTYADVLGPRRSAPGVAHTGSTPQHTVIAGRADDMQLNAAGGYVFKLDDWSALRRFLVLGTTENTYYASTEKLTADAMTLIDRALAADPIQFVDTVVGVSESGAPLKQSPCIFAIARACSLKTGDVARDTNVKDPVTIGRAYALAHARRVLRTFQHLFEFLDYCGRQRGAGTGLRRVVGSFFLDDEVRDVEYQALKYRNREGWTPRDALRYAHPKTTEPERNNLLAWITKAESEKGRAAVQESARLAAFEHLQTRWKLDSDSTLKRSVADAAKLISTHRFTHEFVPNELLGSREVWEALLPNLPPTALTRNLRKMTQVGLLVDGKDGAAAVATLSERLLDADRLKRARLHPLRIMMALQQYRSGTSRFGHGGDFVPSGTVIGVLEQALELSFRAVEPLNRSVVVGIDSSGSMRMNATSSGLKAYEAAAALALWYRRTEGDCKLVAFDTSYRAINVSNRTTLVEITTVVGQLGGGTDCSLPYRWCLDNKIDPEVVMVLTDNETWAGYRGHPVELLGQLRKRSSHPIANVVAATTATTSTIGDLKDPHTLNVVGFDPTVPEAVAAHVREVFQS